ncbi:hypothetical protein SNE40_009416 [Patella caerulea]|uniref:Uncharacterized protein n=1 Tax=Patella caerulea TaxID=87958 RepID=A0AAN8JNS8_PATCE
MADWIFVIAISAGVLVGTMVLRRLLSRHVVYKGHILLTGKTVIVTGANCGIGKATTLDFARRNARIIMACRDLAKAEKAVKDIRKVTQDGQLIVKHLDLASLQSVRTFCEEINREEKQLDILINNAGVFQCPFSKTVDGFEMQMGVNHFGHFLLTNLLLDLLQKSTSSRIVVVSSALHKRGNINFDDINSDKEYSRSKAYADSKLANIFFAQELSQRLKSSSVNVYCVHPGMVWTNLGRHVISPVVRWLVSPLASLLIKSSHEGAQTIIYCSIDPELNNETGLYYGNCKTESWTPTAQNVIAAKKLWDLSESLTGLNKKTL